MTDQKISALTAVASVAGTNEIAVNEAGTTKKVTVTQILSLIYPVGAVYISVASTSPATLFGGTWSAFATGRTLVGIDTGDVDFDTVEEVGGHKELASHTHKVNPPNTNTGVMSANATGAINFHGSGTATALASTSGNVTSTGGRTSYHTNATTGGANSYDTASISVAHTHAVDIAEFDSGSAGTGNAKNLQPYIVTYMWKRTA